MGGGGGREGEAEKRRVRKRRRAEESKVRKRKRKGGCGRGDVWRRIKGGEGRNREGEEHHKLGGGLRKTERV